MRPLTEKEFRRFALGAAFLSLVAAIEGMFDLTGSAEAKKILEWNYYGAILPYRLLLAVYWYGQCSLLVGLVGFVFFKSWGRGLLLFCHLLWLITGPLSGVIVYPPVVGGIAAAGGAILLALLTLSYFPPHNVYFMHEKDRRARE